MPPEFLFRSDRTTSQSPFRFYSRKRTVTVPSSLPSISRSGFPIALTTPLFGSLAPKKKKSKKPSNASLCRRELQHSSTTNSFLVRSGQPSQESGGDRCWYPCSRMGSCAHRNVLHQSRKCTIQAIRLSLTKFPAMTVRRQ